jgi:hypothetical protein
MTILMVGVCVGGMVRHNGFGFDAAGHKVWGITGPTPCQKCGGKGCAKPAEETASAAE